MHCSEIQLIDNRLIGSDDCSVSLFIIRNQDMRLFQCSYIWAFRESSLLIRKVADDQKFFLPQRPGIKEQCFIQRSKKLIVSIYDNIICMAETDQFFVI